MAFSSLIRRVPVPHLLGSLGPAAVGFIIAATIDGGRGVAVLLRNMTRWRAGLPWWLVAVPGPVAVFGLGASAA